MEISELRIGNKVFIGGKEIIMDSRIFHAVIHGFEGYEPKGILITNERLIGLGFAICNNGVEIDCEDGIKINSLHNGLPMTLEIYGLRSPLYNLKYIHQIQNLYFSLKNTEL